MLLITHKTIHWVHKHNEEVRTHVEIIKGPADRLAPVADCYSCWSLFTTFYCTSILAFFMELHRLKLSNYIIWVS